MTPISVLAFFIREGPQNRIFLGRNQTLPTRQQNIKRAVKTTDQSDAIKPPN